MFLIDRGCIMLKQLCVFLLFSVMSIGFCFGQSFELFKICENNGTISISWETAKNQCSGFNFYTIHWKEATNDDFEVVDSVFNKQKSEFQYNPSNTNNIRQWEYYIRVYQNCTNDSFVYSDTGFVDKDEPNVKELDSVSIRNGEIVLGWDGHQAKDVKGYNIYYVDADGQTSVLDSVPGRDNTTYVDSLEGNPNGGEDKYRLAVYDSCDNVSPISLNTHQNSFLQYSQDSCAGEVNLNWSDYKGWDVESYSVFLSKDKKGYEKVKTLSGDSLSFKLDSLEKQGNFEAFVRAKQDGGNATSSSNKVSFSSSSVSATEYTYIREVTVIDSNLHLNWFIDKPVPLTGFEIMRGESKGDLSVIDKVDYDSGRQFQYVDSSSETEISENPYFYKVVAKGICDNDVDESNVVKSIVLRATKRTGRRELRWDNYRGFNGSILRYEIERIELEGDRNAWSMLEKVPFEVSTFQDNKSYDSFPDNGVCYRVKAIEDGNNQYGFQGVSVSNMDCVFGEPIVYVPNALRPRGKNAIFRPVGKYIDYEKSSMSIYNRWGQKVFETDDIEEGWNGKKGGSGDLMPPGTYFYTIEIVGVDKSRQYLKGDITLLK